MNRSAPAAALAILLVSGILAQTPSPGATFDVSTVKRSDPAAHGFSFQFAGSRFLANNHTLKESIVFAYSLTPKLVLGGPAWIDSDRFDIVGVAPEERLQSDRGVVMFQALLADRFHLKFHREQRQMSVYNLVVGKDLKLQASAAGPDARAALMVRPAGPRVLALPARNTSIADFVSLMQRLVLDRPVVDKTGLSGRYDFDLEWRIDGTLADRGRGGPDVTVGDKPDIFSAIRGLGLRLEPAKGPIDVLVIDRVERPDAN